MNTSILENKITRALLAGILLLLFTLTAQSIFAPKTHAAYESGNLIDNASFLDARSMSASQIQAFLDGKSGVLKSRTFKLDCDAPGIGGTAKQLYLSVGAPCGATIPVSQIIYYSAQVYGVSPKVILATMQKEQSLITNPYPSAHNIKQAMGYGCPTSGVCDSDSGFFWQVDNGTWVLRYHYERANRNNSWWDNRSWTCGTAKPQFYSPNLYPGQNVNFYDIATGGTHYATVYIHNAATSSFYCYTPHVFNNPQGLYGHPVYGTVGSYYSGSYNFVKFYELWFDPASTIWNNITMNIVEQPAASPARGQTVTYKVSFRNNASTSIVVDAIGIVGRAGSLNGANRDFGWTEPITLVPNTTQEYTFTAVIRDTGIIYAWPAINYQGAYVHYNNWGRAMNARNPNISLTNPLKSSVSNPVAGQSVTFTATVRNDESQPISISSLGIPIRFHGSYNYDTAWMAPSGPLAPGATQTLSGSITFDKPGPYTAWVSALIAGQYTTLSPTMSLNTSQVNPNFTLQYSEIPNNSPAIGEDVALKFSLKNNLGVSVKIDAVGVVGRYDNPYTGANNDYGWVGPVTFAAGETKSFTTFTHNIKDLRTYYNWVAINYRGSYIHYNNWGFMLKPRIPNITLLGPLTVNSGKPIVIGQRFNVSTTIKNNEQKPIRYSALGLPARFWNKYNYDIAWQGPGVLEPGEEVSISGSTTFDKSGPYTIWSSIFVNGRYITLGQPRDINL